MKISRVSLFAVAVLGMSLVGGCDRMSSTVTGTSGRKLTIIAPASQSVRQGEATKVTLAINRTNFNDPVEIDISDLPHGVTVAGGSRLTIPAGSLKIDSMTLVADMDAKTVIDHRVSVTAKGPDGIAVTEFFKLTVTART